MPLIQWNFKNQKIWLIPQSGTFTKMSTTYVQDPTWWAKLKAEHRYLCVIQQFKQSENGPLEMPRWEDPNESTRAARLQPYPPLLPVSSLGQNLLQMCQVELQDYKYWNNLLTVHTLGREGADLHHSQTPSRTHCKREKNPSQILFQLLSLPTKVVWDPSEKLKEKEHTHSLEQGK